MPAKKETAKKKGAIKKKKLSKGQVMTCEVCGLAITVEEIGDDVIEEDSVLLCCGKPMKEKKPAAKAAK